VLAASAHLTDRDRLLVRCVAQHRVLTTGQLAALGFGSITTARHRLAVLVLAVLVLTGLLRRFRPHGPAGSAPWHYVLGPVGAALLGVEDRDEHRWAPHVRADRQLALGTLPAAGAHDRPEPVLRRSGEGCPRARRGTGRVAERG
jgi:hypothetical protein